MSHASVSKIAAVFASLLGFGCAQATDVAASGSIADHPTLGSLSGARGELELCLDVEVTAHDGSTTMERACGAPDVTEGRYHWRGEVGGPPRTSRQLAVRGAELTYRVVEALDDCVVEEGTGTKRVVCEATTRQLRYERSGGIEADRSVTWRELQVPLDWDLAREPHVSDVRREILELPGIGITAPSGECIPQVGSDGTWLAADGGRSIALPNDRWIHLFGDTLVEGGSGTTFVGNSVGVGQCRDGEFVIDYAFFDQTTGARAVFDLDDGRTRLWPVDGIHRRGKLFVVLAKIIEVEYGLGFDYAGSVMAIVDNPGDDPLGWRVTYRDLTGVAPYRPTKGLVKHDGYLHLYSELVVGDYPHPAVLLRLPLDTLEAPEAHVEFMARGGAWKSVADFDAADVHIVAERTSPNMYVHRHEALGKWVTVHGSPDFGSPDLVLRTADQLEGPWSEPVVVYKFPEMLADDAVARGVVCYAATEHAQLRVSDDVLVATYACNTLQGPLPSKAELDLYRPKSVRIDLAALGAL